MYLFRVKDMVVAVVGSFVSGDFELITWLFLIWDNMFFFFFRIFNNERLTGPEGLEAKTNLGRRKK
jgi:hypothetical protein